MDTRTLHTDTSTYRIDTVVEGLNGYFRTLTRDTGDVLDRDQTFLDLRDLLLEQALQEERSGTTQHNLRIRVVILHLDYYGTYHITLSVEVRRDLVLLRQVELVPLFVQQQDLFLPYLVQLTRHDLATHIFIMLIERLFLQFEDLRCQRLTEIEDHTATERSQLYLIRYLFTDLCLLIQQQCIAQRDLRVGIRYVAIFHHQTVAVNLQIALIGVHDDRIVSGRTVHLQNNRLERLLQHRDQRTFVDTFVFLKVFENVNQVDCFLFVCHFCYVILNLKS